MDEAVRYGTFMAQRIFTSMPDLASKGMCVTVYDGQGEAISIVPVDPVN